MEWYRKTKIVITAMCMTILLLSGCGNEASLESKTEAAMYANANDQHKEAKSEEDSMIIKANETEYEVVLDQNESVKNIVENMPLTLDMVRYAGHEFYSELPFTPAFAQERTSEIKAGHVYYWDGWNAFVINYIDSDISPYKVVHIGEIKDKSICDVLADGTDHIRIDVR